MRHKPHSYSIYSGHRFYTPGVGGSLVLVLWLFVGALLGNVVTLAFSAVLPQQTALEYATLVSYLVMFVPPVIYVSYRSHRNAMFDTGYELDNSHYGRMGFVLCALLAMVATVGTAFMCDAISSHMPQMPAWLIEALEGVTTDGPLWLNFLCVSICAPLCEEWLCRGMILRGLLNCTRSDGSRGLRPVWAIVISAFLFGLIHANPWQAIPAFLLGCLFGYVYYRTGSLKLTMLMHFTNNTMALVLSRLDSLQDAEYWTDILGPKMYYIVFAAMALLLILIIRAFNRIPLQSPRGCCDEVSPDSLTDVQ